MSSSTTKKPENYTENRVCELAYLLEVSGKQKRYWSENFAVVLKG